MTTTALPDLDELEMALDAAREAIGDYCRLRRGAEYDPARERALRAEARHSWQAVDRLLRA